MKYFNLLISFSNITNTFSLSLSLSSTHNQQLESCALQKDTGNCQERHARWHFSQNDNKCMPFYYSGCDGNKNSYVSLEECEGKCPRNVSK